MAEQRHRETQATLINELTDLGDASVVLVVGVPTFTFRRARSHRFTPTAAQLSQYFQNNRANGFDNNRIMANNFSNAIMTQGARMGEYRATAVSPGMDGGPLAADGAQNEDLFVHAGHITPQEGRAHGLPLAEFPLSCTVCSRWNFRSRRRRRQIMTKDGPNNRNSRGS